MENGKCPGLTTNVGPYIVRGDDERLPLCWGESARVDTGVDLIDEGVEPGNEACALSRAQDACGDHVLNLGNDLCDLLWDGEMLQHQTVSTPCSNGGHVAEAGGDVQPAVGVFAPGDDCAVTL